VTHLQKITCTLLATLLITGCTGLPEGVHPVGSFELVRYLGKWYEIARLDHSFERGLVQITAEYSMREDGGVRVVNRGFNPATNSWKEAEGRAYFVASPDIGQLKVSFFGPFYGGYNIIALDQENYTYAMVAGPDHSYLWILAREPELDSNQQQALIAQAAASGFPVDKLIFVDHASQ
jgi:apolipoprotein D and lipocalin family protein